MKALKVYAYLLVSFLVVAVAVAQITQPGGIVGNLNAALSASNTFTGALNTFTGAVTVGNLNVTSATVPTTGLSKSGGGSLVLSAAGVAGASISSGTSKTLGVNFGVLANGTKFTAAGTGCTVGATVGGNTAGTFTLAAGPCTSVAITLNGATGSTMTNGWACFASDRTAPTVLISQSASTTTTATFSIPAGAGATDVVSFGCLGY